MLFVWRPDHNPEQLQDNTFKEYSCNSQAVLWLDLEADAATIFQKLEALQILHPLTLERIQTKQSRAFLDEFDDYIHILLQEIHYNNANDVELEECHFILGCNFLITIHEVPLTAITTVKQNPPTRFFSQGSDVLFFHIAEPLIGVNFGIMDEIADLTENIEDRIFPKPDRMLLNELFDLKRDLIAIRRTLAPMREIFSQLSRRENPFVDQQALPFMSLLYDQLIRLHEISDTQREIIAGALEIYLTSLSNRTNDIMMTLTIVSTIILPLTLIVGFYGMNFEHFPGIGWKLGIPYVLLLMLGIVAIMLWYFKRKKWF